MTKLIQSKGSTSIEVVKNVISKITGISIEKIFELKVGVDVTPYSLLVNGSTGQFYLNTATGSITEYAIQSDGTASVITNVGTFILSDVSLKSSFGASYIGTTGGSTVQVELNKKFNASEINDIPYTATGSSISRTVSSALNDFVNLHDFYIASDGDNWIPAFTRAFLVSNNILIPFGVHVVASPVILPSNVKIIGLGSASIVKSPTASNAGGTNIVTVFRAVNMNNIEISNLTVDGGVSEINTVKNYTRTLRFTNCTNVILDSITVINNADWSTSFEKGSDIKVVNYTQKSYKYTNTSVALFGGRDGLHFTDVSNVVANGLDIDSGDDCVGITTTGTDMDNIHISNVVGSSSIASIVIFNEEQDAQGNYYSCNLTNVTVQNVSVKKGGLARNIVRFIGYNTNTVIKNLRITNVIGTAYNSFGLWVGRASEVFLNGIDVKSRLSHGVQLSNINKLYGSAKGVFLDETATNLTTYVGVNMTSISNSTFSPISYNSASYGIQILTCTNCTITPDSYNCGGNLLSSNTGGNLRAVNNTNLSIPSGRAYGDATVSYWGINQSGNTNLLIGQDFVFQGVVNSTMPNLYYLKVPTVDVKIKEDSSGTVTTNLSLGGTLVRNSVGNYTISFTSPMRSTNFSWFATAYRSGALVFVRLSAPVGTGSITLQVVDASNVATYADHIEFKGFNVGT